MNSENSDELTISFEELVELVKRRYPGAVKLKSDGQIVRAVSRLKRTKVVACVLGINWPADRSQTFDLKTNQFIDFVPGGKYGKFGAYRSWYYREILPQAQASLLHVQENRRSSNMELLDGDSESGFNFRKHFERRRE